MNTKPPCKVIWYGEEWICRDQLQKFRFPRKFKECFFLGCPGRGPYVEPEPVAEPPKEALPEPVCEPTEVPVCSFFKCDLPQAPGRKYCGDQCRLRSARWNYEQRNKEARRARKRKRNKSN